MKTRQEAEKYLEKYIPSSVKLNFPAQLGLTRSTKLLDLLDNPQEKYQVIHIAGTSGKGTTAYTASRLLISHSIKTGLHLSPHLEDIRERMEVNGKFISDKNFLNYLSDVLKAAEECERIFSKPTYFELLTALAMYAFWKEKVEVAVIETGMGGTFDATNIVKRSDKIAVITRIGHDHTNILGKTLSQIASHKAGIIQQGNRVITLDSKKTNPVFEKRAKEKKATLTLLGSKNIQNITVSKSGTVFDLKLPTLTLKDLRVALLGKHQAENVTLAISACTKTTPLNPEKVRTTLSQLHFKGRIDQLTLNGKTFIIDGAHNEQKMRALTSTLKQIYPNTKFTVILAIKKGKSVRDMLNLLLPITETLITTTFFKDTHDLIHIAYDQNYLTKKAKALGFKNVTSTKTANQAIEKAKGEKSSYILTTGSLYYLQDIYKELESR